MYVRLYVVVLQGVEERCMQMCWSCCSLNVCPPPSSSGLVFQAVANLKTKEDLTGFFDAIEVGMGGLLVVGGVDWSGWGMGGVDWSGWGMGGVD